jgi:hypothetical protein
VWKDFSKTFLFNFFKKTFPFLILFKFCIQNIFSLFYLDFVKIFATHSFSSSLVFRSRGATAQRAVAKTQWALGIDQTKSFSRAPVNLLSLSIFALVHKCGLWAGETVCEGRRDNMRRTEDWIQTNYTPDGTVDDTVSRNFFKKRKCPGTMTLDSEWGSERSLVLFILHEKNCTPNSLRRTPMPSQESRSSTVKRIRGEHTHTTTGWESRRCPPTRPWLVSSALALWSERLARDSDASPRMSPCMATSLHLHGDILSSWKVVNVASHYSVCWNCLRSFFFFVSLRTRINEIHSIFLSSANRSTCVGVKQSKDVVWIITKTLSPVPSVQNFSFFFPFWYSVLSLPESLHS